MKMVLFSQRFLTGLIGFLVSSTLLAASLQVTGPAIGVEEIDLRDMRTKQILRSINTRELAYPIMIKKDLDMGYVINIEGKDYYVGAADVRTNKVYNVNADCPSQLARASGASRGIAGKGCHK